MPTKVKTCSCIVVLLLILGCCTIAPAQAPDNRVAGKIDDTQVTTLQGNVHPMARAEFDRGVVNAETALSGLVFQLNPSTAQQAALDALVEAQHDPQSPLYHQWLTPAEYGARFGASEQDLVTITRWLFGHGFVVQEVPLNHRQVIFSGNAGQVEDAFHTEIHHYLVGGVSHIANTQDPQIPSALASVVGGIVSLHDFRSVPQIRSRTTLSAQPQYDSGSTHYLFPSDLATIYNLNPLYQAGTTGAGASIAIVGRSNINLADVSQFRATAALVANNPSVILVSTNPGLIPRDQDESTLDVEWSGAVAPSATVKFVIGASTTTTDGIDLAAQYIVNHVTAPVMSTSYGGCEADMGAAELSFYNSLWQQAASEGISSFVSSGDAGAAGCYAGSATSAASTGVNGLCSSPYATCVGGTEFNEGPNAATYWSSTNGAGYSSARSYVPEVVWNESGTEGGSGLWSSGGGASLYFSQPSWQKGVSGAGAAGGMRAVPDVAMSASAHDGYLIVENGSYYEISGTSAASPTFAGVMALVVQSNRGAGQGNANPELYALLNASRSPFHATPSGNNSVPGVTGFTAAGAPYNLATGLGSVDATVLASEWGRVSSPTKSNLDFVLTPSVRSGTVFAGRAVTFTLNVTESGTARNKISLTATAPPGVSVSINQPSILPGTMATVTATSSSTGEKNIILTGKDATGMQTATYSLTVAPSSTLTLNAAAGLIAVAQGGSSTVGLSAVTGGSFSGSINYSVSGLPGGVTAKWSANPQTARASVSTNDQTLTLTASATAALTSATVVVTADGDGVSASKSLAVQVQAAPGVQLVASPQTLSLLSTSTATLTMTASPMGGLVLAPGATGSTISIAAGLPKGFKASWSVLGMTSSGAVAWKLTLTGGASAIAGTSTVGLSVALAGENGSVYKATANLPVNVTFAPTKRLHARPLPIHSLR